MNETLQTLFATFDDTSKEASSIDNFHHKYLLTEKLISTLNEIKAEAHKETGYGLKSSGKKYRENINAKCREILERVDTPEGLTEEERRILGEYSGRGGTSFNSQTEYYTPTPLASAMWDLLKENGFRNGNVLEPSTGAGVFCGTKPSGVIITGSEIDATSSKIAQLLNPKDALQNTCFEKLCKDIEDGSLDAAIGNVPFGDARGEHAQYEDDPYYKKLSLEKYFILRSIEKVREDGLICFVCPNQIVGGKGGAWEEWRTRVSNLAEFLGAHKMPSSTFQSQGTKTVVDVVVWKKHPDELVEAIRDGKFDENVLSSSNVHYSDFIKGAYWNTSEGKKFIHGEYIPKDPMNAFSREQVKGKIKDEEMKHKLSVKFKSRIDWGMLEILQNENGIEYKEGDVRQVNGKDFEYKNGVWVAIVDTLSNEEQIDKARYGVATLGELKALAESIEGCLSLTYEQCMHVFEDYKDVLNTRVQQALKFAHSQPKIHEQAYRGSLIGELITDAKRNAFAKQDISGSLEAIRGLLSQEVGTYGIPINNNALSVAKALYRPFAAFVAAVKSDGSFSDFILGKKQEQGKAYDSKSVSDIVRYLRAAERDDQITVDKILRLYDGDLKFITPEEMAEKVHDVAYTPDGFIEPLNTYCSGEVISKLDACKNAIVNEENPALKERYQAQIDIIEKKRKHTDFSLTKCSIQSSRWIPWKYFKEFLESEGFTDVKYGFKMDDGSVKELDDFIDNKEAKIYYQHIPDTYYSLSTYMYEFLNEGKEIRPSTDGTVREERYHESKLMKERFDDFLHQHQDADFIGEIYDRNFLRTVSSAEEDESELVQIKDVLSGQIVPHNYQNAEVRRLSNMGTGVCGFGTGLGKSFTALALAAYNYKTGRHKKTCIVVPNSVLENWYHEARTMYSEEYMRDNVKLVGFEPVIDKKTGKIQQEPVTDVDGNPVIMKDGTTKLKDKLKEKNNKQDKIFDLNLVAQNPYSLVIMTKETFKSIPVRNETKAEYNADMIRLNFAKKDDGTQTYKEDKQKEKLKQRINNTGNKEGDMPFFEDLGFDSIITDESHYYKNSIQSGEQTSGYAYMPVIKIASQIGSDMFMKSQYVRKKNGGVGVYGLTATPVSNSPLELFNILTMIIGPKAFKDYKVNTQDEFIREFCDIDIDYVHKNTGEFSPVNAVKRFKNFDALSAIYRRYVNVKEYKDIAAEVDVPEQKEENVIVVLSDSQQRLYEDLRQEASTGIKSKLGENGIEYELTAGKSKTSGEIFKIMRKMARLTTDEELYYDQMTFYIPASKFAGDPVKFENTEEGKQILKDVDGSVLRDPGGNVIITIHGLREEKDNTNEENARNLAKEKRLLLYLKKIGIEQKDIRHEISSKYSRMIENVKIHFNANGKQLIFSDEKSQHHKIGRILLQSIPDLTEKQIGYINADDASGKNLDKISSDYNKGIIKIVIANQKAEVGVNLQIGTVAIHHLTLPWTPASIIQRNGRGVRQGNPEKEVKVYYYLGKGTFDAMKYSIIMGKYSWFSALRDGDKQIVENDAEGSLTEDDMDILLAKDEKQAREKKKELLERKKAHEAVQKRKKTTDKLCSLRNAIRKIKMKDTLIESEKDRIKVALRGTYGIWTTDLEEAYKEREYKNATPADKSTITRLIKKYNSTEERITKETETLEKSVVEPTKQLLRSYAKKGEIEFDTALIEDPGLFIISPQCYVFKKGDFYEIDKYIYEITDMEFTDSGIKTYTTLIATKDGSSFNRSDAKSDFFGNNKLNNAVHCSVSRDEILIQKIVSERIYKYTDVKLLFIKDAFNKYKDRIKFKEKIDPDNYFVVLENNKYTIKTYKEMGSPETAEALVYPEEDMGEKLLENLPLRFLNGGYSEKRLWFFFNDNFKTHEYEFKSAVDFCIEESIDKEKIVECTQKAIQKYIEDEDNWIENECDSQEEYEKFLANEKYISDLIADIKKQFKRLYPEIDTGPCIVREIIDREVTNKHNAIKAVVRQRSEQKEEIEKDERETITIPSDVLEKINNNHIVIMVNKDPIQYKPFPKAKNYSIAEPYTKWVLGDYRAAYGKLKELKDDMKARCSGKAIFTRDFHSANHKEIECWWLIDYNEQNLQLITDLFAK